MLFFQAWFSMIIGSQMFIFLDADELVISELLPFVFSWIAAGAIVVAFSRSGIDLHRDHLIVKNGFRDYRLDGSEVTRADLGRFYFRPCIELHVVDGLPLRTWLFTDLIASKGLLRNHIETINEWVEGGSWPERIAPVDQADSPPHRLRPDNTDRGSRKS